MDNSPQAPDPLQASLRALSENLHTELKKMPNVTQHSFERGPILEDEFRDRFGAYLPKAYQYDVAHIVDNKGTRYYEGDFVIFDDTHYAPLVLPTAGKGHNRTVRFEATYAVIEVKTTLSPKTLKEACGKIHPYKELERMTDNADWCIIHDGTSFYFRPGAAYARMEKPYVICNPPFGLIFAFDTSKEYDLETDEGIARLVQDFSECHRDVDVKMFVNGVFILNKGALLWYGTPSNLQLRNSPRDYQTMLQIFPEHSPGEWFSHYFPFGEDTLLCMHGFLLNALNFIELR